MENQILMTELDKYPLKTKKKQKYAIKEATTPSFSSASASMFVMSDFGFVLPKKYIRKTEKQMFSSHPEVRDPRKLLRLAGVRSQLAQQIKNKERILGKR